MSGGLVNNSIFVLPSNIEPMGWYGKLPGTGDFAQRRLPSRFVSVWDRWLQNGFEYLKFAKSDWAQSYLEGHIWFFTLGPSIIGPKPWLGVLVPSVDSVGRYFPLTIAIELFESDNTSPPLSIEQSSQQVVASLLDTCARVALKALEQDNDAQSFDAALISALVNWNDSEFENKPIWVPKAARSAWHIGSNFGSSHGFSVGGMPGNSEFSLLFASADAAEVALKELAR
jgi:type VI secretion system protein ImpM